MNWTRVGKFIGTGVVYGVLFVVLAIGAILFIRSQFGRYLDNPPVNVTSVDELHLGHTCPGDDLSVHNMVEIEKPVVAIYYISVLDRDSLYNILDTQVVYNGFQHPRPGIFTHTIPYNTPDIPPGEYVRSFAARGTNAEEKTVFITSTFTIASWCLKEITNAKSSPDYRVSKDVSADRNSVVDNNGVLADE